MAATRVVARDAIVAGDQPRLRLHAGWGVKATLDGDGYLRLAQTDQDGATEEIVLARHEALELFETFQEWAHSPKENDDG